MSLLVFFKIDSVATIGVCVYEIHELEVKHMECFSAHNTNKAVFVKPLHRVLISLIVEAHLNHLGCRLLQIKLLVVEEAIGTLEFNFFSILVLQALDG